MNILISADIVPTRSNVDLFKSAEVSTLVGDELLTVLREADYRIFNLETPLTNDKDPIRKCGPNLIAPIEAVNGYKGLQANLLAIANNHILDQGAKGLKTTIKTLHENGIAHVGAGINLEDAQKPYIFESNQMKIGVYACAEHEFTIAGINSPGANPYDPLESFDAVYELRKHCDFLIVLYHGGKEYYRYPSPKLQRVCHKFVEKGADLVVCQHSHCIGCEEKYLDKTIVYGQGNFIFDECEDECWQTGLLIKVTDKGVSYIPIEKDGARVRAAKDDSAARIISEFNRRSEEIRRKGFIEEKYRECAEQELPQYLQHFRGRYKNNLIMKIVNKLTRGKWIKLYMDYVYNDVCKMAIVNCVECEAHRECVLMGLKQKQTVER